MKENRPTSIIQRLIRPEEIADFVTYLSSPKSSAINGSALRIDGAWYEAYSKQSWCCERFVRNGISA